MASTIKLLLIFYISLQVIPTNSGFVSKRSLLYGLEFIKSKAEAIIEKSAQHTKCGRDLKALIADLYRNKMWAYHMVDSSIKLNPGLLSGNFIQFGNYEQCLAINENRTGEIIKGQYCSVIVLPTKNDTQLSKFNDVNFITSYLGLNPNFRLSGVLQYLQLIFGVCIPASCSIHNLQAIWDGAEKALDLPVHAKFEEYLCSSKDKPKEVFEIDYYVYIFFAAILVIVCLSTIYDLFYQYFTNKEGNDVLVAFSLYTNTKKLFSSQCENHNLTCMYGIKVISMIWVVGGHRFAMNAAVSNVNAMHVFEARFNQLSGVMVAAPYAVDTFLTISGILIAYIKLDLGKKYNLPLWTFYSHRFIRLGPALLAIILFHISIIKYLADGPFWDIIAKQVSLTCYKTGWLNLLFLNNLLDIKYQCVIPSWYLAVDSQLYAIAPLILHNFMKRPKGTLFAMVLMAIISLVYTTFATINYNLGCLLLEFDTVYYNKVYFSTLSRIPAWLIGIFFGFLIYHSKNNNVKINKTMNILCWLISVGSIVSIVLYHHYLAKESYSVWIAVFYNAFSKPIWAFAVGFVIFACSTGNGGAINSFLSGRYFIVIGKLTYCMYLVHIAVQIVLVASQKQAKYFSNLGNFHDSFGDLVFVFGFGALLSLIFEAPVFALLKILQKNTKPIKQEKKQPDMEIAETSVFGVFLNMMGSKDNEKKND